MIRQHRLLIRGMTCEGCVQKVEKSLNQKPGIQQISINLESGQAVVTGSDLGPEAPVHAIEESGFSAKILGDDAKSAPDDACCTPTNETKEEARAHGQANFVSAGEGQKTDLLVLGGGSAAFAAAIRGHELGADVTLVNKGTVGGTCVNVGCIPSKTLLRAAEARHRCRHHEFQGIDGCSELVDFSAVIRQKDELVQSLRESKYLDVLAAHERVRFVEGEAKFASPNAVEVDGEVLRADRILIATGSAPWIPPIPGLREAGPLTSTLALKLGGFGEVEVGDDLESNVSGIYAAGDVAGEPAYFYTAAYEGRLAAENALTGNGRERDYTALPWVIFTDPQIAGVGWNEGQAVQAGIRYEATHLELSDVPRALAARDTRGFIKLLRDPQTDVLLGAHILAPEGGDLIMEPALAIRHQIAVSSLASAFHPYLTQAEAIKLCAQTFGKDVRTLSCCSA